MKRVLLATAGALVLAGAISSAGAADLGRRQTMVTKAPPPVVIYNWTGFYAGISGGWGFGDSRWDSTASSFDVSGGLVGGTLGYNWQFGQGVFGIEADLSWSDIKGSTTTLCPLGCETKNTWLGTARARLGYAADRFMPYVTGGAAFGEVEARTPGFPGASDTRVGWTAGGGLEFALAGNWTAKAEYLYVDLGKFDCGTNCGGLPPDNVSFDSHIIRGGLNYRF
jgi:outer membrane immunogenic protein